MKREDVVKAVVLLKEIEKLEKLIKDWKVEMFHKPNGKMSICIDALLWVWGDINQEEFNKGESIDYVTYRVLSDAADRMILILKLRLRNLEKELEAL